MPTYQYVCTECGHDLEAVQSFSDDALTECPQCGGRLRKVFSAVGVVFKGSGFYRTDSRGAAKDGKSGADKGSGPDTGKDGAKDTKKPVKADSTPGSTTGGATSTSTKGAGSGSGGSSAA